MCKRGKLYIQEQKRGSGISLAKNIIFLYLCNRGNNNNNNLLLYLIYILFAPIYISILSSPRRNFVYAFRIVNPVYIDSYDP